MAVDAEDVKIGHRARRIRKRRGLSLDAAAGLTGISKGYLSKLENGHSGFTRRGLLEDLAGALGCSVADLTGQPYLAPDRATADALACLPAISLALHECTLTDVPDVPARPVGELSALAAEANRYTDETRYALAGRGLGPLLTELHVQVVTGAPADRRVALAALVEACIVVRGLAGTFGHYDLAAIAARRGYEGARLLDGRADLVGLMAMSRTMTLSHIGARWRAYSVASDVLTELAAEPGPTPHDTATSEARGMLHLSAALVSARDGRTEDASTHLGEAQSLSAHTGERNHLNYHFGPANVAAWSLSLAVEAQRGPAVAATLDCSPAAFAALDSADRRAGFHLDLSRAWAQDGGARDGEALRHLDAADRVAPTRVRSDPIAREVAAMLRRRAKRQVWELDSLCNRLGLN